MTEHAQPAIPEAFIAVSKALCGDAVDPRELWDLTKNMDSSEVHVSTATKPRRKKKDEDKPHSNVARGLVLGAAAEGVGTYRAGEAAYHAVRPVARGVKMVPTGSKALKVGEFGLQAANLGIGLTAAHKLSQHAKKEPLDKAFKVGPKLRRMAPLKWLRPVKVVMSDAQATEHAASMAQATRHGARLAVGTSLLAGGLAGHGLARRSARRAAEREAAAEPVTKAVGLRPVQQPTQPVAGVRAINSGGLGPGLGRHGRMVGGKTPAPTLQPVAKPPPPLPGQSTMSKSLTWTGEISKVDEDKRQVFGWCSLAEVNGQKVVDLQGDWVPLDEIEKSAYTYVIESRKGGDMHARVRKGLSTEWTEPKHTADMIESFVVTPEKLEKMGLASDALPLGWWTGFKVNDDEQWELVKSGKRSGFSIHGTGSRSEMAKFVNPHRRHEEEAVAALAGGAAGQGAYQQTGYSLKHHVDVTTRKGNPGVTSASANHRDKVLKPLKVKYHMHPVPDPDTGKMVPHPLRNSKTFHRTFPKELKGAGIVRALGHTHEGKTGTLVGTGATVIGAGGAAALAHHHLKKSFMPTKGNLGEARKIVGEMPADVRGLLRGHLENTRRMRVERKMPLGPLKKPSDAANRPARAADAYRNRGHVRRLAARDQRLAAEAAAPPAPKLKPVKAAPKPKILGAQQAVSNRTLVTLGATTVGGGGAGYAAHRARVAKDESGGGHRKTAAALGAVSGGLLADAAHTGASQGIKVATASHRKANWDNTKHRAVWDAHRHKYGVKQVGGATANGVKQGLYENYPKRLPGWQGQRALAHLSKPAVQAGVIGVGAVTGAAIAARRHNSRSNG